MTDFLGKCQCGRLSVTFRTDRATELPVRACQCSFCRRHGSHTIADPAGEIVFRAEPGALHRYQFGMRSADFLICATCGTYVGVIARIDGKDYAAVNVVGSDIAELAALPAMTVNVDQETRPERDARRRRLWSSARVVEAAPAGAA